MKTPFCRVFRVDGSAYAYDVNTGDVVAVDEATAAVLDGDGDRLPAANLIDARRRIAEARGRDGVFLDHRPASVAPCPDCHAPGAYDGGLRQLSLSISEQCNLRCGYCRHGHDLPGVRPHRDERMSRETARAAVREFLRRSRGATAPSISFYGGEPLLETGLIRDVIALVRREGPRDDYRFIVDTNGTRLDAETVAFLVSERVDLQVSLDGPPGIHDRHRRFRGGGPTHAEILAGLARLFEADPGAHRRVRYQVTLAPPSDPVAVGAWFAVFPPHEAAGIDSPPMVGANVANLDGIASSRLGLTSGARRAFDAGLRAARRRYVDLCVERGHEAVDPVLRALFDGDLVGFYHRSRTPLGDAVSPGGACRPGQRRLHVCADGRYQPCERLGEGMVIGSAAAGLDLDAVGRLWRRFEDALGGRCRDCWAVRRCPVCFTSLAGLDDGSPLPASICDAARRRSEGTLEMWVEMTRRDPASLDFLKASSVS